MRTRKKKVYIIYEYKDFENDFKYIKEYHDLRQLQDDYNLHFKGAKTMYNYITKSIDDIKQKIDNKYIIIQETIED